MVLSQPADSSAFSSGDATPLMAQYLAIKAMHPDCLVFFRLGDFYEMFFEDAEKASRALDIALTRRGQYRGKDIPMCGVPFHSYENYLARLIKQGYRVAICEQTEAPAAARKRGYKAIVAREVVRIVTPGTVTEESLLDARSANFLACIASAGSDLALAWLDLAAAEPCSQAVSAADLGAVLARVDPNEIIVPQRLMENPETLEALAPWRDKITPQPDSRFDSGNARKRLENTYQVKELSAFGDFSRAEIAALGALLDYAALTQKNELVHLAPPRSAAKSHVMEIDAATRRNLEIVRSLNGEREGSLLAAIDRTQTAAGARLLAARLSAPLTDCAAINGRLDAVEFFLRQNELRDFVRKELRRTPDIERALARIALGRGGPRDLSVLRTAIKNAGNIKSCFSRHNLESLVLAPLSPSRKTDDEEKPDGLQAMPINVSLAIQHIGEHASFAEKLDRALADSLPVLARDGGFIARGFSSRLDELVELRDNSRRTIAGLQRKYEEASGAASLKIRHNNVIGYYIEATPTQAGKLLAKNDLFIHRQTLAGAVRFTTAELSELERRINEAADKALAVELGLFEEFVQEAMQIMPGLRRMANALAELDVMTTLAELAREQDYRRPEIDRSSAFDIKGGRHPVVEQSLRQDAGASFVPNDCDLGPEHRLWLVTGPNMAGKSTFLRQNALIALLAQAGCFVPAASAHIGVVDRLFSRVGAADDLARGRSTFMVEMVETAAILNQAGERSLVILDEIGRGTATYDGLSIAWAALEHLHEINRCRTLFATHYHELTRLAEKLPSLHCVTMRIREWKKEIVFLHEVTPGVADRSYGIHVARMAGMPKAVTERASEVLKLLENGKDRTACGRELDTLPLFSAAAVEQNSGLCAEMKELLDSIDPDALTPKEALEILYRLRDLWKNRS